MPLVGAVFYLLIGERRVGLRRARRIAAIRSDYAKLAQHVIDQGPDAGRLGQASAGGPRHGPAGHLPGRHSYRGRQHGPVLLGIGADPAGDRPGHRRRPQERADGVLHLERRRGRRRGARGPGSRRPAGRLLPRAGRCGRCAALVERPATPAAPRGGRPGAARPARQLAAGLRLAKRSPPAPQDRRGRRPRRLDGEHEPGRSPLLQAGAPTSGSGSMPWSAWKDRSSRRWP